MFDALLTLLALGTTKTATFQTPSFDSKAGTTPTPLFMFFTFAAATNASGSNSWTFNVEHSDDNSVWYLHTSGAADIINLSTTSQNGEIALPIITGKRYVRGTGTLAGAGSTPTINVGVRVSPARPG